MVMTIITNAAGNGSGAPEVWQMEPLGPGASDVGWGGEGRWNPPGLASQATGRPPAATVPQPPACQSICHPVISSTLGGSPRGSRTKRTEQGVTFSRSSQRRGGTDGKQQGTSRGWSLRRRLLNKTGEMHIMWSRGSRGQRALSSGPRANQPLLCLHGRPAKGGLYVCKCLGETKRRRVFHENPMKLKFQRRVKMLPGHGHAYSFAYRLWLLPCDEGRLSDCKGPVARGAQAVCCLTVS